jgi:hypothetical protein
MNIYEKISNVQSKIADMKLHKTGKNKFGGFEYYELDDILPPISKECQNSGLLIDFTFRESEAILTIRDCKTPEKIYRNSVMMPPLKELNSKMNLPQSLGAYMTYLKRYLLMNTFLIPEKDTVDSEKLASMNNVKSPGKKFSKPSKSFNTANNDKPLKPENNPIAKISDIKKKLHSKGEKVTASTIYIYARNLNKANKISDDLLEGIKNNLESMEAGK